MRHLMNGAQATGLCECGCGQPTRVAKVTDSRWGHVAGQPVRWVNGHQRRLTTAAWVEEDRGYETPCWIWQRCFHRGGYGAVTMNRKTYNAHRAVYEQRVEPLPSSLTLDHLCRVRACVNPAHMEPVANAVNLQRGATAKLTPEKVEAIRRRAANGEMQRTLAEEFGVSSGTLSGIVCRRSWRNIP
jgi:hypothetical protein